MALRFYQNPETQEIKQSLKDLTNDGWVVLLSAPNAKFMEKANPYTNRSKQKDMDAVLQKRANEHSLRTSYDDSIQASRAAGCSEENIRLAFLNSKGTKRKKIDSL